MSSEGNFSKDMTEIELKAHCLQNPLSGQGLHTLTSDRKRVTENKTSPEAPASSSVRSTPLNTALVYEESEDDKKITLQVNFVKGSHKSDWKRFFRELEAKHGWKTFRTNDGSTPIVVVPRGNTPFKRHLAIENLEFFRDPEALASHFQRNTCLYHKWENVWYQLQEYHHWEEIGDTYVHQPSIEALAGQLVPGLHVFKSKDELMTYVQRFPFLLQTDVLFEALLEAHLWQYRISGNRKEYEWRNTSDTRWLTLGQTRKELWTYPDMLFCHYPDVDLAHILDFIRGFPAGPSTVSAPPSKKAPAPQALNDSTSVALPAPAAVRTVTVDATASPMTPALYTSSGSARLDSGKSEGHIRVQASQNETQKAAPGPISASTAAPAVPTSTSNKAVASSAPAAASATVPPSASFKPIESHAEQQYQQQQLKRKASPTSLLPPDGNSATALAAAAVKRQRTSPSLGSSCSSGITPRAWDSVVFLRVAGPSDCRQYLDGVQQQERQSRRRSDTDATSSANLERKQKFEKQKTILHASTFPGSISGSKLSKIGWRREHIKVPNMSLFGDHEDIFICPRYEGQTKFQPSRAYDSHIENLEYFHHWEALATHLEQNPCLLMGWKDLWSRLSAAGWEKTEKGVYEYRPALEILGSEGLIDGVHRFRSILGLKCYIDKFPFLLQSEDHFWQTLVHHKFEASTSPRPRVYWPGLPDDSFHTADISMTLAQWVPLKFVRRLLWTYPVVLFHHYYNSGEISIGELTSAIRFRSAAGSNEKEEEEDDDDDELHSESEVEEETVAATATTKAPAPAAAAAAAVPPAGVTVATEKIVAPLRQSPATATKASPPAHPLSVKNTPAIASSDANSSAGAGVTVAAAAVTEPRKSPSSPDSILNDSSDDEKEDKTKKSVDPLKGFALDFVASLEKANLLGRVNKTELMEAVLSLVRGKLGTSGEKNDSSNTGIVRNGEKNGNIELSVDPVLRELQQIRQTNGDLPRWACLIIELVTRGK